MGESIKCNLCGNPATVHLTQIIDKKIQKIDLCESCAQQKGVTDPEGFSLAELVAKNFDTPASEEEGTELRCEQCGMSPADFRKSGRLGCPACYQSMEELIQPILKNMHRGEQHLGKIPQRMLRRAGVRKRLDDLQEKLKNSIHEERYEDAARFRDEIEQVRADIAAKNAAP